jgi:hypothetical protein
LHRDFCVIAICEEVLTYSAGRVPMSWGDRLESLAASLQPTDRVVMEVFGGAWEVARRLAPHVKRVVVVWVRTGLQRSGRSQRSAHRAGGEGHQQLDDFS